MKKLVLSALLGATTSGLIVLTACDDLPETVVTSSECSLLVKDGQVSAKIGPHEMNNLELRIHQPLQLMSKAPVPHPQGWKVMYLSRYKPSPAWLVLDTVRQALVLDLANKTILNHDVAFRFKTPTADTVKLLWYPTGSRKQELVKRWVPLPDTFSGQMVLWQAPETEFIP